MSKQKKKKTRRLLEQAEPEGSGLARALGSTDGDTREQGLIILTRWLESHENLSQTDILKLWKALYFCYWHSDHASVQTALAERLSGLLSVLPGTVAFPFYRGFIETMRREWFGIDQHRINKFMMLVRKFYHQTLVLFSESGWDRLMIQEYGSVLKDEVLLAKGNELGNGFAYHITDIVISELIKIVEETNNPPKHKTIMAILDPFIKGLELSGNKILVKRIAKEVFSECENVANLKHATLAQHLFSLGAKPETKSLNREYLYLASSRLEHAKDSSRPKSKMKKKTSQVEQPTAIKPSKKHKKNENRPSKSKALQDTGNGNTKKKTSLGQQDTFADTKVESKKRVKEQKTRDSVERRKSVRFSLKRNLVRTIGQPPYPEDIRTPPTSRPTGSALKKSEDLSEPARKRSLTFDGSSKEKKSKK